MISLDSKLVGTRMKQKRLEKGLTQADVATKSGISSRYYGSIENGKNSPSIEKLSAIAKVIGCSLHFLLNDRMDDMEKRVDEEKKRLENIFDKIPRDKLSLVEGLITQAARLRILLDDNWKDIIENGEYEKFKQSENQIAYDRKRPIVESYDNRDKNYQAVIKQLTDLLPQNIKTDKKSKLLGRK
ncbi:helix-turn-helix domain-containing protein [Enterococcus durans]|uniref:helix-turn-helix domain-containing protein n=2 Tax=Enterococcus durans TaxID=53345 RepID=UPI003566AFBD|nr:helix-turn-helix domain-containing protein [Enterococcus durans]MCB8514842.1 helix-turn-helix domain-containing protein [Enterococcus durans]